ncbi:MAG: hypothetical protein M4D80_42665 [Myxococcota bacterium]|nr:hypothetical protein [Myxococcota bacterium]
MFDLQLVGEPRPLDESALDGIAHLSKEYVDLMKTWGPGRAKAHLDFPDPRGPAFATLQLRYRLHAPHQKAMGRWTSLDASALESGIVIARFRGGEVLVGVQTRLVRLSPNGKDAWQYSLESTIDWCAGAESPKNKPPKTYSTELDGRAALYAALASGNEELADACMGTLFEHESAWGLLEVAWALSSSTTSSAPALRAAYFDRCMRMVKRVDPECIAELPLRVMRDEIANAGALSIDHARALEGVAHAPSPFEGEMTDIEQQLAAEIIRNPRERAPCIVLADHLEGLGQTLRASLVREQAEAMSFEEIAERGLEFRNVDGEKTLAEWLEAWGADAPADHVATAQPLLPQHKSAIVSWIVNGSDDSIARLAKEPAAPAFLVLGLRSKQYQIARNCALAIAQLDIKAAAPHLLSSVRATPALEQVALAYHDVGRLSAKELTAVLDWLESDSYDVRRATCVVLQRSAKDDRVLEALLTHFCDGHPYTERAIAKRKTDARVVPALLEAFDRAEAASLKDGRNLVYTTDYGILSRYLAKLGNVRGKEAWERFKKMGRIDRAAADREARREGM